MVHHHPGLRQREAGEHADGIQLDQQAGLPAERDDQHGRRARQHEDAVREDEPVAAVRQLPRHVAVAGDDRRQPGEVRVGGVRGQHEDRERGYLEDQVHRCPATEDGATHDREQRLVLRRRRRETVGQHCDAEEVGPEDQAHVVSVFAAFFDSGFWNAGTPFEIASTPESAMAPDEKARSNISTERPVSVPAGQFLEPRRVRRKRLQMPGERLEQAADQQQAQREDVDVGRPGEQTARLLHAPQVGEHHEQRRTRDRAARAA